jgi:hypothetical protein
MQIGYLHAEKKAEKGWYTESNAIVQELCIAR